MKRYSVWSVKQKNGDAVWVPAGQAILNRDGTISVYLDVLPLDGKLTLRERVVPEPPKLKEADK